mgnify:CR=1 FL=1
MSFSAPSTLASSPALPVRLDGVGRTFPGEGDGDARLVLRDVDLDIAAGEIVALIGASGCGKSTLLRQISGLDVPSEGAVTIDGRDVVPADQRCAVAFQEPRLLPWRTLTRNVELGIPRALGREDGRRRVADLLELVQLSDAAHLRPRQISGGMAQRVSLARAFARGPGVLLLDEHQHRILQGGFGNRHAARKRMQHADLDRLCAVLRGRSARGQGHGRSRRHQDRTESHLR